MLDPKKTDGFRTGEDMNTTMPGACLQVVQADAMVLRSQAAGHLHGGSAVNTQRDL